MTLTLSIIIPTKDRPHYLRSAVTHALAALPEGGEVIVIDDHGAKPAQDSLRDITDPRLRILCNAGLAGPASARNCGVAHSRADVILFADDDDLIRPDYPHHVLDLATQARYGFCATDSFTQEPSFVAPFTRSLVHEIASLPFKRQMGGLGCGFWVYLDDFIAVCGINPALRVNEDTDFSIKLRAAGLKGFFETSAGVMIRQHSGAPANADITSVTKRTTAFDRAGYFKTIITDHADFLQRDPQANHYMHKRLVKMYAKSGQLRAGVKACGRSPVLLSYFLINAIIYYFSWP